MSEYKYCSCFGHRKVEITEKLCTKLNIVFKNLIIKENVRYFYFGGFGEFDELYHKIISNLKIEFPDIYRIFCLSDPRHLQINKRPTWIKDKDYENITYLDLDYDYWYTRIYYRNLEIINRSDFIVFYINHTTSSDAYKALQYAKQKKKQIINICDNQQ